MTDRELLELAAKAHGGLEPISDIGWIRAGSDVRSAKLWSPLTNSDDAMRLAVKCRISFGIGSNANFMRVIWYQFGDLHSLDAPDRSEREKELVPFDEVAWLRRAIVRAAAEIGKQK